MTNNDILRRIRYIFSFDDSKMMSLFSHDGVDASRSEISGWLKKEEDEGYQALNDETFARFLDAFITLKRGAQPGVKRVPDKQLSNNSILMKLKIAVNYKTEDIIAVLKLAGFNLSPHELSAFFRKPGHKHYRKCKDQVLRNFLKGLQIKYVGPVEVVEVSEQDKQPVKKSVETTPTKATHNIWGSGSSSKKR